DAALRPVAQPHPPPGTAARPGDTGRLSGPQPAHLSARHPVMSAAVLEGPALAEPRERPLPGAPVRPKASRDDWAMRLMMLVIGAYLVVAIAIPLGAVLLRSIQTFSFSLAELEVQVHDGGDWSQPRTALD